MTRKIGRQKPKGSKRILPPEEPVSTDRETPAFCLRYIDSQYSLELCSDSEKIALVDQMRLLSQMSWIQIKGQHRHGAGSEKINRSAIKRPIPIHITDEIPLLAFRFDGKKAMVGYRLGRIFHIVWLDCNFTLYSH